MSAPSVARRGRRHDAQLWLLLVAGILTAAGLALIGQAAALMFCAAQTAALCGICVRAVGGRRGWRSAQLIVAVAWGVLFTLPCWLYGLDPELLDTGTPARATLIVNIALYGYLLGLMLRPTGGPPVDGTLPVAPMQPRSRALIAWWLVGFVALAVVLLRHGSPLEYIGHLDRSAALNRGAFAIVAVALIMRFAALAWAAGSWSQGERMESRALVLAVTGTVLIGLTGGRLFVVVALADFLLLYVLLRRPIPLRRVAPYVVAIGVLIVFGVGTIKRHQGYNAAHPDAQVGLADYATRQAPAELASAYANNYFDGVRLIAIADELVPRRADWEGARAVAETLVKPLPHSVRPEVAREQVLRRAFNPTEDYAYAMPLIATSFLAGGMLVVLLVSIATGALVGALERRLASGCLTAGGAAVVVVAAVSLPSLLRAGLPAGAVFLLVDVAGMWLVARTGLRASPERTRRRG